MPRSSKDAETPPNKQRMVAISTELVRVLDGHWPAAALLSQIAFWAATSKRPHGEFYKFAAPAPGDPHYRIGDSWLEELSLSRAAFEGARKRIATRITRGVSLDEVLSDNEPFFDRSGLLTNADHLVAYWRDKHRCTWYRLNRSLWDRLQEIMDEHASSALIDMDAVGRLVDAESEQPVSNADLRQQVSSVENRQCLSNVENERLISTAENRRLITDVEKHPSLSNVEIQRPLSNAENQQSIALPEVDGAYLQRSPEQTGAFPEMVDTETTLSGRAFPPAGPSPLFPIAHRGSLLALLGHESRFATGGASEFLTDLAHHSRQTGHDGFPWGWRAAPLLTELGTDRVAGMDKLWLHFANDLHADDVDLLAERYGSDVRDGLKPNSFAVSGRPCERISRTSVRWAAMRSGQFGVSAVVRALEWGFELDEPGADRSSLEANIRFVSSLDLDDLSWIFTQVKNWPRRKRRFARGSVIRSVAS